MVRMSKITTYALDMERYPASTVKMATVFCVDVQYTDPPVKFTTTPVVEYP